MSVKETARLHAQLNPAILEIRLCLVRFHSMSQFRCNGGKKQKNDGNMSSSSTLGDDMYLYELRVTYCAEVVLQQ